MSDTKRNVNWDLSRCAQTVDVLSLGVLMDIRDELREIKNRLDISNRKLSPLECRNFLDVPNILRGIRKNTARKKRKAAK